ncbi:MAG: DUF2092 domain-containing protein [Phycisphaerales bacterium]|nr:MAG: DUF2092 domain-containing protein [Phycisphaerales bacterium]
MKRLILATLILGLLGISAPAGQDKQATDAKIDDMKSAEAKNILEKSRAALEQVRMARYDAKYKGTTWITAYVPAIEGSVVVGEPSEYDVTRFWCDVKLTPIGSEEVLKLTAGSDGDMYYVIDHQTKTAHADIDPAVMGSRPRDPRRVVVNTFVSKDPLQQELEAEKIELKEDAEVGGEPCHQILVTYGETQQGLWFVSKNDCLPRRVVRVYKNEAGEEGTTELELTNLKTDTKLDTAPFELKVPEGYAQSDDFAP